MPVYTYSDARKKLAALLELSKSNQNVIIRRRNGELFRLTPVANEKSPLDVPGVPLKTKISSAELVKIVRENRER